MGPPRGAEGWLRRVVPGHPWRDGRGDADGGGAGDGGGDGGVAGIGGGAAASCIHVVRHAEARDDGVAFTAGLQRGVRMQIERNNSCTPDLHISFMVVELAVIAGRAGRGFLVTYAVTDERGATCGPTWGLHGRWTAPRPCWMRAGRPAPGSGRARGVSEGLRFDVVRATTLTPCRSSVFTRLTEYSQAAICSRCRSGASRLRPSRLDRRARSELSRRDGDAARRSPASRANRALPRPAHCHLPAHRTGPHGSACRPLP